MQKPAARIIFAPMEGVTDHLMRALASARGGIDRCVTEFLRVTDTVLPRRVFLRTMPELERNGLTPAGTPVYLQLLGSNPDMMAANAARAAAMGAAGIDLNFGCPAKTVNRHRGGAALLDDPATVGRIAAAVRVAVPHHIPVTAKMRLGYLDKSRCLDNALALQDAGINELCVHARTKVEGYRPPAYWEYIGAIRRRLTIPVIANGEIWCAEDARNCRMASGCERIMLGRGLLADPDLARRLSGLEADPGPAPWPSVLALLLQFQQLRDATLPDRHGGDKLKQWLLYLRRNYRQAGDLFDRIKRLNAAADIQSALALEVAAAPAAPVPYRRVAIPKSAPTRHPAVAPVIASH